MMLKNIANRMYNENSRSILFLSLSALSLVVSFFHIGNLKVDAAWIAIVLCGVPIIKGAFEGLVSEFDIKADVLVSLALIAAVAIGEIFAAGEVAFIMALGAHLEEHTVAKARAGIEKLIDLSPRTARICENGIERIIPAEKVQIGDMLRVLAGETIAVDGIILSGHSAIDQSVMTGESLPVDKETGDEVFSGTVNQFGTFDMKAMRVGEDSSLQRMVKLVESADAGKAKIVGMADRWATWIVVIALVSAILTWLITGEIIRAVTILVVFCPCALVLATPTAIMAGIGNATKHGILVREGDALERLAQVTKVAFDKTGTLTHGKPYVIGIESFFTDISGDALLRYAAASELRSEHPLGKAIVAHFRATSDMLLCEPQEFALLPGRGIKAMIEGKTTHIGNRQLLAENDVRLDDAILKRANEYKQHGATIVFVAIDHIGVGLLALSDILRSDSAKMVNALQSIDIDCILLTGDNQQAAGHIAECVGIGTVHATCLPIDKMSAIERYQSQNELVCMVGDGINDAPALKIAHVGIAMGGIGSDIAIDAADIALIRDDIKALPHLFRLSKKTMATIKVNLALSMLLNFMAIILAMTGVLGPVLGALVHNVGSVVVIINSARLLHYKGPLKSVTA